MSKETITNYYQQDHERLEALFRQFQEWKRKDAAQGKEYFIQFKLGLQRHIVWEEEILFPLFERKSSLGRPGPTDAMRMEHRQIKGLMEAIHQKVQVGDPASETEEAQLLSLLGRHNQKEEDVLYPGIDHLLNPEDLESVFRQMAEVPEERYDHCCEAGEVPVS